MGPWPSWLMSFEAMMLVLMVMGGWRGAVSTGWDGDGQTKSGWLLFKWMRVAVPHAYKAAAFKTNGTGHWVN